MADTRFRPGSFTLGARPRRVANFVGAELGKCVVESVAPSVSNCSRFRVRCHCGDLFHMNADHIRERLPKDNADFGCPDCFHPRQGGKRDKYTRPARRVKRAPVKMCRVCANLPDRRPAGGCPGCELPPGVFGG
jgi:hypothetical protein